MYLPYALAGNTNIDLTTEPLGFDDNGQAVYLEDVMPSRDEIETYVDKYLSLIHISLKKLLKKVWMSMYLIQMTQLHLMQLVNSLLMKWLNFNVVLLKVYGCTVLLSCMKYSVSYSGDFLNI